MRYSGSEPNLQPEALTYYALICYQGLEKAAMATAVPLQPTYLCEFGIARTNKLNSSRKLVALASLLLVASTSVTSAPVASDRAEIESSTNR